jgi:cytochrome c oxidase subunit 4
MDKQKTLWDVCRAPVLTWTALLMLLALTCGLAYVPLGSFNFPISLLIAGIKATIVAAVFMRLAEHRPLNRLAAGIGPIWIFILFLLTFGDYLTR